MIDNFNSSRNKFYQPHIEVNLKSVSRIRIVNLSIFSEHRFSFYYWNKWQGNKSNMSVVSFDWHTDTEEPMQDELEKLNEVNLNNDFEMFQYTSFWMSFNNDTQIKSALWLNKLKNVYILTKDSEENPTNFIDKDGNIHKIYIRSNPISLLNDLKQNNESDLFFDIDLDYFTQKNPANGIGEEFTYISDKEIEKLLHPLKSELIEYIFKRIKGVTIALEPLHTGGYLKCVELLNLLKTIWVDKFNLIIEPDEIVEINKILK